MRISCTARGKLTPIFLSLLPLVLVALWAAPVASAQPGGPVPPPMPPSLSGALPDLDIMGAPPEGTNDWSCVPSEAHPRPVVLVHGTDADMQGSWPQLSSSLADQGYCVYALNYGGLPIFWDNSQIVWGVNDIEKSAAELEQFVDAVLRSTGAAQVDLVGHSQGGTMARQYLKFNGGADASNPADNKVHRLVTLGATNHGTSFNGLQQLYLFATSLGLPRDLTSKFVFGLAGSQQLIGSPLLQKLNAGSEVMPGVEYTVIATRNDNIVTPPERTFLDDRGTGQVTNLWVQDVCPANTASHMELTSDPDVGHMVSAALDPAYAQTHPLVCADGP